MQCRTREQAVRKEILERAPNKNPLNVQGDGGAPSYTEKHTAAGYDLTNGQW